MIHMNMRNMKRSLFSFAGALFLICVFVLAGCGTNTTTGSPSGNGGTTPTPTSTTAPTAGKATANGCPSSATFVAPPTPANVILTNKNSGNKVSVKKGDIIEVDLPFGHEWSGPSDLSQGPLTMQGPAGYESASSKACVWRFVANSAGTVHLSFIGRPLCKKGQLCPMYVMAVPFTIEIK